MVLLVGLLLLSILFRKVQSAKCAVRLRKLNALLLMGCSESSYLCAAYWKAVPTFLSAHSVSAGRTDSIRSTTYTPEASDLLAASKAQALTLRVAAAAAPSGKQHSVLEVIDHTTGHGEQATYRDDVKTQQEQQQQHVNQQPQQETKHGQQAAEKLGEKSVLLSEASEDDVSNEAGKEECSIVTFALVAGAVFLSSSWLLIKQRMALARARSERC